MNKKVLALAVAGALSAPAAALAQVTVGGSVNILFYSHDPDNDSGTLAAGAGTSGDRMESSESEINIRAGEKLGGGLDVWVQCASSADGIVGGTTQAARVLCTRNSALGFRGSFGNVFFGNWDTPMKLVQNAARGWFSGTNALYGGSMIILAGDSQSGAANTGTSFYRRQANSANYQSPNWGGFTIAAAFSASNESTTGQNGTSIPDSSGLTPRLMGVNGMFRTGGLLVGLAYEKHDDYGNTSTGVSGTDDAYSLLVGYRIAGVNARALYQQNKYENGPGLGEVQTGGFGVYVDWNIQGPHTLHFGYAKSDDVEDDSAGGKQQNTSADWMNIAYSYDLSKRTQLLFAYNQLKNDSNVAFSLEVQSSTTTLGGKGKSIGFAVRHRF
ncbi:MAG: porin [Terriglobia bacterium]